MNREHTVALVPTDVSTLQDIEMTFYATPSGFSVGVGLRSGEDFKIYLNEFDVTDALLSTIRGLVSIAPKDQLSAQYLQGATSYINLLKSTPGMTHDVAEEEHKAAQIAATSDWPAHFAKFGDRTYGWTGNLHPINFLYRYMSLPSVSLQDVWGAYCVMHSEAPRTLRDLPLRTVTFCQGPWTRGGSYNAGEHVLAGSLIYQLEASYENPLKGPLEAILKRVKDLAKDVDNLRTQYLEPSLSHVEQIDTDMARLETSVLDRLQQLTDTVNHIA